jgi:3,4-dihydroxy 2-butanone 4-phosphate synthase/GTP cyclohydrolase II
LDDEPVFFLSLKFTCSSPECELTTGSSELRLFLVDFFAMLHLEHLSDTRLPTLWGTFVLSLFREKSTAKEHLLLWTGDWASEGFSPLVRIHSECLTGDVFGSLRCDCGQQLADAMQAIAREGRGAVLYLRQEGRGIGLSAKLKAYALQDTGMDTVDANLALGFSADERDYTIASDVLKYSGVTSVRLLTNNPDKVEALQKAGIRVAERIAVVPSIHPENTSYLRTKVQRLRHIISLDVLENLERQPSGEG